MNESVAAPTYMILPVELATVEPLREEVLGYRSLYKDTEFEHVVHLAAFATRPAADGPVARGDLLAVGSCGLGPDPRPGAGTAAWNWSVAVAPAARRSGVASAIVAARLVIAHERGHAHVLADLRRSVGADAFWSAWPLTRLGPVVEHGSYRSQLARIEASAALQGLS